MRERERDVFFFFFVCAGGGGGGGGGRQSSSKGGKEKYREGFRGKGFRKQVVHVDNTRTKLGIETPCFL